MPVAQSVWIAVFAGMLTLVGVVLLVGQLPSPVRFVTYSKGKEKCR